MYVTRPLSACRKYPNGFLDKPNEGPSSGYIVITDEEAQKENTCCWGTCEITSVTEFPFPQDRVLNFQPSYEESAITKLWFIPVLDMPLSYNLYYVICAEGKHRGLSCTCSREADEVQGCFGRSIQDMKPKPFDYRDVYQKFKIHHSSDRMFYAQSMATDGFPPKYLRKKSWEVRASHSYQPQLEEASGLDTILRARLPDFSFPISCKCPDPVLVGKWYCPFVFFKEDGEKYDQMKKSIFYRMILKQRWEKIYTCENVKNNTNEVTINVNVQKEDVSIFGMKAEKDDTSSVNGYVWFRVLTGERTWSGIRWGMSMAIFEKMKWLQKEGGYIDNGEKEVNVEVVERVKGGRGYKSFCCYILVESFVLTRLDGSLVMNYEFRHTQHVQCKWE